ncbi:hypothetical protein ACJIZ3_002208 [Penstemon smallii]|uniref:DDT domain-containing protein DDB_G0282237 n=1 Tax=Penstemon smallii TaxID=265156 RepID=A0ABD3U661_9LAMI
MPLYKKKPYALVEKPNDLKPQELVFQIRFTNEIFRSYNEYLKRINLYRKNVWTCKATGKSNLTYEEALVSENKASERIQNIPIEYVAPVLRDVQFSMLNLQDLVNSIAAKFLGPFQKGAKIYGRKDGCLHPCKIVKVVEDTEKTQYKIAWLSSDHKMIEKALVNRDEFAGKDPPFSKRLLKSFIKDSTYRRFPWVLHDNLAKKHGISTAPPEELNIKVSEQNGLVVCDRKRKRSEDTLTPGPSMLGKSAVEGNENQPIKYPIDDLLVQPTEEDRLLVEKPSPCRDFNVPMGCVGDLLMVWDFCTSFGRLLKLSPFSLEDFENSICHKDGTPLLIVESYSTLLQLLINDNGKFSATIRNRKRKRKITQITWTDYLCDFLETSCTAKLAMHMSTIKRGHYGLLDIHVKLTIFQELVAQALVTDIVRDKLAEYIEEERQALSAARRDEKKSKKSETSGKEVKEEQIVNTGEADHSKSNGVILPKNNEKLLSQQGDNISTKNAKKLKIETNTTLEDGNRPSKREAHKLMNYEMKELPEMKNTEDKNEFLEREIEKRFIRTSPLGKDRNYCRYWFFRRDGRIFVESSDSTKWGYYQTKEEIDALIGSLNPKGEREKALKDQLLKIYSKICSGLQKRSKEAVQRTAMEKAAPVRRSTRVLALSRENLAAAFLKYVNKWKEI